MWYCSVKDGGEIDFEAASRDELIATIAKHYSEGYAGPDEDSSPPEYLDVRFSLDGDDFCNHLNASMCISFNTDVQATFEAAIEGWDQPSDVEEHGTHWELK